MLPVLSPVLVLWMNGWRRPTWKRHSQSLGFFGLCGHLSSSHIDLPCRFIDNRVSNPSAGKLGYLWCAGRAAVGIQRIDPQDPFVTECIEEASLEIETDQGRLAHDG